MSYTYLPTGCLLPYVIERVKKASGQPSWRCLGVPPSGQTVEVCWAGEPSPERARQTVWCGLAPDGVDGPGAVRRTAPLSAINRYRLLLEAKDLVIRTRGEGDAFDKPPRGHDSTRRKSHGGIHLGTIRFRAI